MSEVKLISDDDEVLEYSELFKIRDRLEQYLKDGIETTFIRQMDRGDGKISLSIFSVHTLKGDSGFSCLVFPDRESSANEIEDFLRFKQELGGFKSVKDEGSMNDEVVGQS